MSARVVGRSALLKGVVLVTLLGAGLWARSLPPLKFPPALSGLWPWTGSTIVTLYFRDGRFLFPVSRRMPTTDDLPRATLQALLDGPGRTSGLTSAVPPGVGLHSFTLSDGVVQADLSAGFEEDPDSRGAARTAVVATLTSLPGIRAVEITVEGQSRGGRTERQPLLYYASAHGITAVPVATPTARAALEAYVAGPPDVALTGLPRDVRLVNYAHDGASGVVSLDFTYTDSVRAMAIETPALMRFVLIGLTTSLTEFADVRAVRIDFEGRSRLGLGECSDLLRIPQPRPRLLNDERLLLWNSPPGSDPLIRHDSTS